MTTNLDEAMGEVVPMLGKTSITLDHVNAELEKVGKITDSAVDTVQTVDHAARAVTHGRRQARSRSVNSAVEGARHAFESFKASGASVVAWCDPGVRPAGAGPSALGVAALSRARGSPDRAAPALADVLVEMPGRFVR